MLRKTLKTFFLAVLALGLLTLLVYFLPPVKERVDTRVELWAADVKYALNPPEEVVFVPQGQDDPVGSAVTATLESLLEATPTLLPDTPTPLPDTPVPGTPTPGPPTLTPTITPMPLPGSARISGVEYQHQHGLWNYCGPANLAMAVSFWGWQTDRIQAGSYLRGGSDRVDDKNVMPYEMQNFVNDQTGLRMIVRYGGNLELLKTLIAAGFPVIVEKDDVIQGVGWLGHYLLLVGYDDEARQFMTMDTYHGEGTRYDYDFLVGSWRAFNFTFLLAYPPEKEEQLFALLGDYSDESWATQHALEIANQELITLSGRDLYFAWFNRGTSLVALQDYAGAASAYDTAFSAYADLSADLRPWRMLWYQTGPYFAYYFSGRYFDVIALADQTLDSMKDPILEESFYWRGLAKEAVGDWEGALEDMQVSVDLNPNFGPGRAQLERMQGGG